MSAVGVEGRRVGYVGLGNMGGALATRLQQSVSLVVLDRSAASVAVLTDLGARAAADLPGLAAECDIILLCLPTSAQVRDVIFGENGLLGALRAGTILVDQTTGDPVATRAMAAELYPSGIYLIDAPVSGGIAGAQNGTITIMVGAEAAEFEAVSPVLRAISPNVIHAGGVGNGQVIKLVNNLMSTVQRALSFEAIALAAKCGVDPEVATEILLQGGGRNAYLEKMMAPRILNGKLDVGFTLDLAHKDLRLACQMASDAEVPLFLGSTAREIYQLCRAEVGGGAQVDTIGQVYDRIAGTQVVPADNDLV